VKENHKPQVKVLSGNVIIRHASRSFLFLRRLPRVILKRSAIDAKSGGELLNLGMPAFLQSSKTPALDRVFFLQSEALLGFS
jgi:hypothetical protein